MSRIAALAATIALVAIVAAPSIAPLGAQRVGPEPARPKGAVADTNDAQAYLEFREYVVITATYGGALGAQQLVDSLGKSGAPTNVSATNVAFLRANAKLLDSLGIGR